MGSNGKRRGASRLVLGIVGALLLVPVVVALAHPHLADAPPVLLVATSTGVLALALLVVQVVVPGRPRWLVRAVGAGLMRLHRAIAIAVVVLVLAHVGALFVYSPSDTLWALSPSAPTFSRLGGVALFCLALTVALGSGWRRFGLGRPEWRVLHVALAVAVLVTSFAHAVTIQGALDGPLGTLLLYAGMAVAGAAILHAALLRPLRMRAQKRSHRESPETGSPGYAIPSETAVSFADQRVEYGEAAHHYLGVSLTDLSAAESGALVTEVEPGGPADEAGLRPESIVTAIGSVRVEDSGDLLSGLRDYAPGEHARLTLTMGGEKLTVDVLLGERDG